jgi:hypothetical protein
MDQNTAFIVSCVKVTQGEKLFEQAEFNHSSNEFHNGNPARISICTNGTGVDGERLEMLFWK